MPALTNYRLFISHAWSYHDDYTRLIQLLDNSSNFSYSNYSVPKDEKYDRMTTSQLKEELKDQIRPVNCTLENVNIILVNHNFWFSDSYVQGTRTNPSALRCRW